MADPIDFARTNATEDVATAIRWLLENGFGVTGDSGPPYSSFGFLVDLEDEIVQVRLLLDRSQWFIELGYRGDDRFGLHVLESAMEGTQAETPRKRDIGEPLPRQLPDGVSWADIVPPVVRWMRVGDRRSEIDRADASWRKAMIRYWRQ